MIALLDAEATDYSAADLSTFSAVVVCHSDGSLAARHARKLTAVRTAIFVGDLSVTADLEQVRSFCTEMFRVDPHEIIRLPM